MKSVSFFDYLGEVDEIESQLHAAIFGVIRSGHLILGPEVERFERALSDRMGGGHGVGVASGTDALLVTLLAWGIGPGDEVITVPNTATPTANAIQRTGAAPVFCDIDPATALIDVARVDALLTPRTRAVIPVHLYGNVVDVPALRRALDAAGRQDVRILEDCAQALGAALGSAPVGSMGDAAAFSFYPTKNLGAYGDGGFCFTRDAELAETLRQVRRYGFSERDYAVRQGVNSRLDELQAAILNVKLPHLERDLAARRRITALYDRELPEHCERFVVTPGSQHGWHLYVIQVDDRERVRAELIQLGIQTGVHYPHPIHLMPGFAPADGSAPPSLPHGERAARRVLSLPLHPRLEDAEVRLVCEAVRRVLPPPAAS